MNNYMDSPETLYHIFSMLHGCELAKAGATCKTWYKLSCDNLLWKHLYAKFVGEEIFNTPIILEAGQWKQLFVECFGPCDVGYARLLDMLPEPKLVKRWQDQTKRMRNRIDLVWKNRLLPCYYNIVEPVSGDWNTSLYGDFPLQFNYLSHTNRGNDTTVSARGILLNQANFSKLAQITFDLRGERCESDMDELITFHMDVTLIDLSKKTSETFTIMDNSTCVSYWDLISFPWDGDAFVQMEDEYGNILSTRPLYDRKALGQLLLHIDWDANKALTDLHTRLLQNGTIRQIHPHNTEQAEKAFLATLYSLALTLDSNKLRGEYFNRREGSIFFHLDSHRKFTEPGGSTLDDQDFTNNLLHQWTSEDKLGRAIGRSSRTANDTNLQSELTKIAAKLDRFLKFVKWHPGIYNNEFRAKSYHAIKLFKPSKEYIPRYDFFRQTPKKFSAEELKTALESDAKGYFVVSNKIQGQLGTIKYKFVAPEGTCKLARFTASVAGGTHVVINEECIKVILSQLGTTVMSVRDFITVLAIWTENRRATRMFFKEEKEESSDDEADEADDASRPQKKLKNSAGEDILELMKEKWVAVEQSASNITPPITLFSTQ